MTKKYANIQRIISLLQEFEDQNNSANIKQFGKWLYERSENNGNNENINSDYLNRDNIDYKHDFLFLINRLARIYEYYSKKFFEGLPVNTLLEFNFLFSINKNSSYNKSDVIQIHLVEYTTGIDILKRLVKMDLINEYKDDIDKRSKKLKITAEGKKVLMEALFRIKKVQTLFFGSIKDRQLAEIIPLLDEINGMHNKTKLKYGDISYIDIMQSFE